MPNDDVVQYVGSWEPVPENAALPTSSLNQSCAVCNDDRVAWLHPLAKDRATFTVDGTGYTLPGFWTLCDACETAHRAGGDALQERLVQRLSSTDDWVNVDQACLTAFQQADTGSRPLTAG